MKNVTTNAVQVAFVFHASITKSCALLDPLLPSSGYMTAVRKTIREIGLRKDQQSFVCRDSIFKEKRSVPHVSTVGLLRFPPCDFFWNWSQFARRRSQYVASGFHRDPATLCRDIVLFESRAECPRRTAPSSSLSVSSLPVSNDGRFTSRNSAV